MPKTSIAFSEAYSSGSSADLVCTACGHGLERVVSKRFDRPVRSSRRRDWVKTTRVQVEADAAMKVDLRDVGLAGPARRDRVSRDRDGWRAEACELQGAGGVALSLSSSTG